MRALDIVGIAGGVILAASTASAIYISQDYKGAPIAVADMSSGPYSLKVYARKGKVYAENIAIGCIPQ